MENFKVCISTRNCFMKKIMIPLILLIVGITSNAQSPKKDPPPPPPMVETVKFDPPKIIKDEEVNVNKPKEPPVIKVSGLSDDDFYKRNPSVSDISSKGNVISLKKKDGTTEKYNMSKKEEDKSFTEKYSVSPIPPPPPPPKVVKSKA
jgi:hypothetical protein